MDHTLLAPCPVIHNSSPPWELRVLQVVATGITLRNRDLAWALKDTARCQATGVVFQAVLVDTAAGTRCKVAMVALQALVDILPMVNPATMAATRADTATSSDTTNPTGGYLYLASFLRRLFQNILYNHKSPYDCRIAGIYSTRS